MYTATELEQTTLHYRQGSSDKIYQVRVEPVQTGYKVEFAYGRRGSTLNTGTKTPRPVDLETARGIYARLVREKMAKGYTPMAENGTRYQPVPQAGHTGITPQLLNPITEDQLHRYLQDRNWGMQEKLDGRRMLIRKTGAEITGINRRGFVTSLPEVLIHAIAAEKNDFLLDGECVGENYHAFDILEVDGHCLRQKPYRERLIELLSFPGDPSSQIIHRVPTVLAPDDKIRHLETLRIAGREGVVFKHLDAPYTPGRPNTGGSQLKHKFYCTLSAVVARLNGTRSVGLRLFTGLDWVDCGNVTVPVNHPLPNVGQAVEVRYLYAFPESRALFQPVYLGARSDVVQSECRTDQLKFKTGEDDEDQ